MRVDITIEDCGQEGFKARCTYSDGGMPQPNESPAHRAGIMVVRFLRKLGEPFDDPQTMIEQAALDALMEEPKSLEEIQNAKPFAL